MFKYRFNIRTSTTFFLVLCTLTSVLSGDGLAATAGPPAQYLHLLGTTNLESDVSQWNIFHDQNYTQGTLQEFSNNGDDSLKVTLMHGTQNYADILAYRNLPAANSATQFSMDVSFLYQENKPVQALEFTMDKWVNSVRWEWALQWQVVPDGGYLAATPKTWRVWNGKAWQSLQLPQDLAVNKWHMLHLYGNIVNNKVHYIGFTCDKVYTDMSQLTFNPAASAGSKVGVGLQLDGNSQEMAYSVYYQNVNFNYQ